MNEDTPDRDDLLGFLAEEARDRPDPEEHPSIETLSTYGAGKLSEEESERIQDHLVACRECSALVLSHKELLRASQAEPAPAVAPVVPFEAKRREPARFVWPDWVLAALFALVAIGFGYNNYSLRSRLLAPVANPPTVSSSSGERGSSAEAVELAQGEEKPLFFALPVPFGDSSSEYVAEVRAKRDSSLVQRVTGLIPDKTGNAVTFSLYSEVLESGSYDIILKHPDGTAVETYSFKLIRP